MRPFVMLVPLLAACTPRAVTPPARTYVVDSPAALDAGKHDLQIDVAGIDTLWGPSLGAGNGRLRQAIGEHTIVEADVGVLHVTNDGEGEDRNAVTGRVGVMQRSADRHLAVVAGVGVGRSPAAGDWGSVDIGGVISGTGEHARAVLNADIGYSAPFDRDRTFTVREPDADAVDLRLPRNIVSKVSLGLELGPKTGCLVIGASLLRFWLLESSVVDDPDDSTDDFYVALGLGARFTVD